MEADRTLFFPILQRSGNDAKAAFKVLDAAYEQDRLGPSGYRALLEHAPELCQMIATQLGFKTSGALRNYMGCTDYYIAVQTIQYVAWRHCTFPRAAT